MEILSIVIANLPALIKAGQAGFEFVQSVREAAQQNEEWTPEMESVYQTAMNDANNAPESQTDAEKGQ